jgi:hypothetical protein
MATEMFAETLENYQYSSQLIPESRRFTLNSCRENKDKIIHRVVFFILMNNVPPTLNSVELFKRHGYFHCGKEIGFCFIEVSYIIIPCISSKLKIQPRGKNKSRPSVSLAEHKQEFLIMKHESITIFQNGVTGSIRP